MPPRTFISRAAMGWRGANLIGGLIVVPPKKAYSIYYSITDWPLQPGPTKVETWIPVYDCANFFASKSPKETEATSHFEFDAHPSRQ